MATSSKKVASHLTDIPDHLLAEIFLRLPAPDDLARTSAACVSFRQIVTDRSFVRRFRRIHAPPLLGFLDREGFNPALPPHPSTTGARALALAADFSFSFLPSHCSWTVQDTRDGRVLLAGTPQGQEKPLFKELLVCDPLHRRYILLPPLPDGLLSMVAAPHGTCWSPWEPFLVPLSEETAGAAEDTTFRVIWVAHCNTRLSAFIFSSSTREWIAATSKAWSDLFVGMSQLSPKLFRRHYAYGCFYWDFLLTLSRKLLVLDTRRMEFSMADLPPGKWHWRGLAIGEAGDGRLGVFGFHGGGASDLSYNIAQNEGGTPSQWQMMKNISLDYGYIYFITDATERYLLLNRTAFPHRDNELTEYFSMDMKTLKLQGFCAKQGTDRAYVYTNYLRIYTNFPPSLLPSPTI